MEELGGLQSMGRKESDTTESWIFIGRTDAEGEAPIPQSPDVKSQLIGKDLDAGKDSRKKEKGEAEDETDYEIGSLT